MIKFLPPRIRQLYAKVLERRMRKQAGRVEAAPGWTLVPRTIVGRLTGAVGGHRRRIARGRRADLRGADSDVLQILALQSGNPERIRHVLDPANPLSHAVAAQVIPLLGSEPVARDAARALQAFAEPYAGTLIDTMLDARQPTAVRRRIPRVLSVCGSPRVVDGLLLGLRDERREVRTQCGRALLVIQRRNAHIHFNSDVLFESVLHELTLAPPDLALVFTLLALVLPRKTVRSAYRALRHGDSHLRGTALEYLESVLRPDIRDALWPHVR